MKCLSLVVFFLATPTIKLKLELHIHGGLLIANHLDQSLSPTNHKYWAAVMYNLFYSFCWEVPKCVAPFSSHNKLHEFGAEKPISWAKPAHFEFFAINCTEKPISWAKPAYFDVFAINCTIWSHMLSTVGDALTHWMAFSPIFGVIQCPSPTHLLLQWISSRKGGRWSFPGNLCQEMVGEQWLCCPRNTWERHHCVVAWGRCE